jgi:hypothetical protein
MRRPELSNVEVVAPDEEEEAVGGGRFSLFQNRS